MKRDWAWKKAWKAFYGSMDQYPADDALLAAKLIRDERRRAVRACRKLIVPNGTPSYNAAINDCLAAIQKGR